MVGPGWVPAWSSPTLLCKTGAKRVWCERGDQSLPPAMITPLSQDKEEPQAWSCGKNKRSWRTADIYFKTACEDWKGSNKIPLSLTVNVHLLISGTITSGQESSCAGKKNDLLIWIVPSFCCLSVTHAGRILEPSVPRMRHGGWEKQMIPQEDSLFLSPGVQSCRVSTQNEWPSHSHSFSFQIILRPVSEIMRGVCVGGKGWRGDSYWNTIEREK